MMTKRKHDIWDSAVGCSVAIMLGITVFAFVMTYLITWTTVFDFSHITPRWWPHAAKFLGYVVPFRRIGNAEFSCDRGTQNVGVYAGIREETPVLVIGPVPHLPCNVRLLILHYVVRLQRPNGGTTYENLLQKPDDSRGMEGILRAQDEGIPCCVISEQTIWITPDELFARVYGIEKDQEEPRLVPQGRTHARRRQGRVPLDRYCDRRKTDAEDPGRTLRDPPPQ